MVEALESDGAMATIRTSPEAPSGRTLTMTLKAPLLTDAGALLSLKSNESVDSVGNRIGGGGDNRYPHERGHKNRSTK